MPGYRVIALDLDTARKVRDSRRSPGYGHPVHSEIATGYGPCRLCLRDFEVGVDRRLLFTCDPFFRIEPFPLPGPVFIHEAECDRLPGEQRLSGGSAPAPADARRVRSRADLRSEERSGRAIPEAVSRLLSRPDVDYLHVRDTEAGCYDFRIERVG